MSRLTCRFTPRIALTICLLAFPCFPQGGESTEILGIIQDTTGAVVPDVKVTATHVATNQVRTLITGGSGTFVFTAMQPGEYTLRAEKVGFRAEVRTGLTLQINQKARMNIVMQVGSVSESVEVVISPLALGWSGRCRTECNPRRLRPRPEEAAACGNGPRPAGLPLDWEVRSVQQEPTMSTPLAVLLAVAVGGLLTFGATRATANVLNGKLFLRWMVVVFVTYLALIMLPVAIGF